VPIEAHNEVEEQKGCARNTGYGRIEREVEGGIPQAKNGTGISVASGSWDVDFFAQRYRIEGSKGESHQAVNRLSTLAVLRIGGEEKHRPVMKESDVRIGRLRGYKNMGWDVAS